MKTLLHIITILLAALIVAGVIYLVGNSQWAAEYAPALGHSSAGEGGISEGFRRPEGEGSQATKGMQRPEGERNQATEGSQPPEEFRLPEGSEGREGGRRGNPFSVASLASFIRTLVPMALVITAVTLVARAIDVIRRRTASAARP